MEVIIILWGKGKRHPRLTLAIMMSIVCCEKLFFVPLPRHPLNIFFKNKYIYQKIFFLSFISDYNNYADRVCMVHNFISPMSELLVRAHLSRPSYGGSLRAPGFLSLQSQLSQVWSPSSLSLLSLLSRVLTHIPGLTTSYTSTRK